MKQPTPAPTLPQTGYVRVKQLIPTLIPVGRSTFWLMVKEGRFPPPVKLGPATTAWRCEDVRRWMEAQQ